MSRYIFSVFCFNRNQAIIIQDKIEKIQLKTILMCNIEENNTDKHPQHTHIVNCLVDIQKPTYMKYAIKSKISKDQILDFYEVSVREQAFVY